ncbi:hypothetical protein PORCRE_1951 [Porphyromonas crevioricanis JCM 15906]|uniref:Uncharacterized protein n=1 Tax=Porphyromonas crevioricanis JCM 15906 TaxID=1305617 RepID=T1CQZ0_9PORP|nr:hypothetical protein PORCRE_1951 [Porphyromonas crevioricanis JCM 15906]
MDVLVQPLKVRQNRQKVGAKGRRNTFVVCCLALGGRM